MEVDEQIKIFREFIEQNYYPELLEAVRKGQTFLVLDFSELIKFNSEISEEILEKPEELLKAAEIAIKDFDLPKKVGKFNVRLKNLPDSQKIEVSNIRSKHLNKLICVEGIVRQKSDVRPHVTAAKFECPSCGNILNVLQLDNKFKEPTRCSCGRKGKFKEISKELVDGQGLVLEESSENLDGAQPKRINVFLKDDLVSPISERRSNPGAKIRVIGWIIEVPITLRSGGKSTKYDLIIEANFIEPLEDDFSNINILEKELEQIKEIAKFPDVLKYLADSIAPSIYGHDKIKEALVLQLAGGCRKPRPDGVSTRGDIHMLLIGDPGSGKCITEDTKIPCFDGSIKTIKEIFNSKSHFLINTIDKTGKIAQKKPTKKWKRDSPQKILEITTQTGKKIRLTKEHPLFTTRGGFTYSQAAENFKLGEFIATPRKIIYEGKTQKISHKFTLSRSRYQQRLIFPNILTKDLARLLGYLIGDGYVSKTKTSGCISFTNNNKQLIENYTYLIKKIFNGTTTIRKNNGSNESYINSISLINFFEAIGKGIVAKSINKRIPQLINKSQKPVLQEFIKALFECEAHINLKKRQIEFSSISQELIEDIQTNLLKFGIISILHFKTNHAANTLKKRKVQAYELIIGSEQAKKYVSLINFISDEKKEKSQIILNSKQKTNTNIDVIPNLKEILPIIRNRLNLYQKDMGLPRSTYLHYELGDRNPSRTSLQKLVGIIKEKFKEDKLLNLLYELAYADIFWDKIKEIKEINYERKVYDFQIDKNHNFIANNFIIHNSQMLKRITKIAPKARFTSGKGATAAGLTASVVKDEFLGGWSLEAGTLVLANRGFAIIDELDKMTKEDRSALHEALEQQSISIAKANIQATLRCETTVLAAANPKWGRFDPYDLIANQINLPPPLISRFDLIFPVKDMPNKDKDEVMASFILSLHKDPTKIRAEISNELLKKYFVYVRQKINPRMSEAAIEELKDYYVSMRNENNSDGGTKSVSITARQLEALIRLSEAAAKIRLAKLVTKKDAQKAIELVDYCLNQIAKDSETGKIDVDRLGGSKITATERGSISIIKEIIKGLGQELNEKIIPIETIIEAAQVKNIDKEKVEEVLDKLRRTGDIFEPKKGFIQRL